MSELRNMETLVISVREIIEKAKGQVYRSSNIILLQMYWQIGKLIVEEEQNGAARAKYGKGVLKKLSQALTVEFGKGYDERNLSNIRAFYIAFPIRYELRTELSWTHYRILSRIENQELRNAYVFESIQGNWNTRTLQRNIDSQYLSRTLELKRDPDTITDARHLIKDPYILEFLGVNSDSTLTESKIEAAIITHLQQFLMELGKGFAFVERQQHIVTDTSDFYIDLVFYNYHLKCFVLLDLKNEKLTPAAIGQMDMYVRMYNDLKKAEDDQPTIGIILCTEKDETMVKYSVLSENEKLFASKYRLYFPEEDELKRLIEADRVRFELDQ
jgi:predicted nuclease of restriction endonuclease-like (RecB) superfamily